MAIKLTTEFKVGEIYIAKIVDWNNEPSQGAH